MSRRIAWGIVGTGFVAERFCRALDGLKAADIVAVCSRSLDSAEKFADELKIRRSYASCSELLNDAEVDVVYIATPHTLHHEQCMLALEAGKAVLCEKPFAINAAQAREVIELARARQLFCMEGVWTRFIPAYQRALALIEQKEIGEARMLIADFSWPTEFHENNRHYNPELGGGALVDRGLYGLALAFHLFGKPTEIATQFVLGSTGVDEQSVVVLKYSSGQIASISTSLRGYGSNEALIIGSHGRLKIHEPFIRPHRVSVDKVAPIPTSHQTSQGFRQSLRSRLKRFGFIHPMYVRLLYDVVHRPSLSFVHAVRGYGFRYEAEEVMRCLASGALESEGMPLDETLMIMETLDQIREQWGLRYPTENRLPPA